MRELDDTTLELQLRRTLAERLGTLPLELTVEALERRRAIRNQVRRRRRVVLGLGLAAAVILPVGWLAAGRPVPRPPAPLVIVVAPTPTPVSSASAAPAPSATPGPRPSIVEELGRQGTGQLSGFGSALLASGRVLLAGGVDTTIGQETVAGAWLFDPATKRFVSTGAMTTPRADPLVVSLADGRALVVGGWREDPASGQQAPLSTAELYDPAAGTFALTAGPTRARRDCPCGALDRLPWALQHVTRLLDGRVFLAGGGGGGTKADVFDPATERWGELDIGCDATRGGQGFLADGRLLIVCVDGNGGSEAPVDVRARLFDPQTDTFTEAARPPAMDSVATALADGRVLLTGREPVLYDPIADAYRTSPSRPWPDAGQVGIHIGLGRVLFLGDETAERPTLLFDPRSDTFTIVGQVGFAGADAMVALRDGRILTVGHQLEARLLDPGQLP